MTNLCFVFQTGQHDCCCTCRIYARCGSCPHELFTRWRLGDQRAVVARIAQLVRADAPVDIAQANEGLRQEILVRQVPRRLAWLTLAKIQERLQRARDRKRKQQKTVSSSFRGSTKIRTCWGSPAQQKPRAWHVRKPWEMRRGCLGRASSSSCRRCAA
ncbi:unnamed protein product [Symbiodinium necroappetens]|uniref:Uncharacterized protein n=1 Tax=Symbiodinium necroappetens TaxID=1628268 RepID=A0A812R8P4_9DINO|nr:unnamed protein product [Symbiodinium necroappetens]